MPAARTLAVGLVALLSGLTACGGSNSPTATPTQTPFTIPPVATSPAGSSEREALEEAIRDYSEAYLGGDAERAWGLLSERCKQRITLDDMRSLVDQAEELYGDAELTEIRVVDLSGDLARATYRFSEPELDQLKEPWVREGGQWHVDDC
jgi:hypothetical protein